MKTKHIASLLNESSRIQNHWAEKLIFVVILFTVIATACICGQQVAQFNMPASSAADSASQLAVQTAPVAAKNI